MNFLACIALMLTAAPEGAAAPFADSPFGPVVHAADQRADDPESVQSGNYVGMLNDGYDALVLRVHLIRNATRSINVQTFILENDEAGRLIVYELIQAAKRGVRVRLLTDHMFSDKNRAIAAFLATVHPNFELRYFRPLGNRLRASRSRAAFAGALFFRTTNKRMHNKLMTFDDAIAIMGGRNLDNHYYNNSLTYNFKDRDILLIGPLLAPVLASFETYWDFKRSVPGRDLKDVARAIEADTFARYDARSDFAFDGFFPNLDQDADDREGIRETFVETLHTPRRAEFLVDPPKKNDKNGYLSLWGGGRVTDRLQQTVAETESSLLIQSPYLILERRARKLFRRLKRERPGVDVRVSTNSFSSTDNIMAYSANYKMRPLYIKKLRLNIYEYKPHPEDLPSHVPNFPALAERAKETRPSKRGPFMSLHAKSFVVDDRISYIGSFNLDPRSSNLNTELGLLIEDEAFTRALKSDILRDMAPGNSWVIAKKKAPLDQVNGVIEDLSTVSPIDLWPFRNTSSFALRPGKTPLDPGHERFYDHYEDIGSFPGANGVSSKEIVTRLYKVMGKPAIPIL